ncbi:hypothetical protein [Robertmurraya kyonggiensis]|uniref:hypothetical protein n=1 Tax=Robertmurraya kyonggiensis TaxID=1037680 RepID=UPI00130E6E56|nr:hypothetical protein [Robertmurraya kyonggiensis]
MNATMVKNSIKFNAPAGCFFFIKMMLNVQVNVKVSWICFNEEMGIMVRTSPLSDGMNLEVKFYE